MTQMQSNADFTISDYPRLKIRVIRVPIATLLKPVNIYINEKLF